MLLVKPPKFSIVVELLDTDVDLVKEVVPTQTFAVECKCVVLRELFQLIRLRESEVLSAEVL